MITIFSIPKPMEGEFRRLQENAIGSWRALDPTLEILLLGEEAGVAECARHLGVGHVPEIERTGFGTPRVDSAFRAAERHSGSGLLCYINADIILGSDFLPAVRVAAEIRHRFLMVGRRWDLDFGEAIDFSGGGWEKNFRDLVRARGIMHAPSGIDYFIYPRGFWKEIPPFAVGRTMWDNWLIWNARVEGAMVIDSTESICAVHQNHGYNHHAGGREGVWKGPEAVRNEELAGGLDHYFTINDATFRLSEGRIRRNLDYAHLRRWWDVLPAVWKPARFALMVMRRIQKAIYPLRIRIARWRGRIP